MKVLVLAGSYRKNGNTQRVTEQILEYMRREAQASGVTLEVETIFLAHLRLEPCRGCRVCFDRGEDQCPVKDDLPEIKAKMLAADGVLIASPVYVNDINGVTKNVIDRLAYICHRPEFAGKVAFAVATVATSPTNHALGSLRIALSTWGFSIAGLAGFKTGALMGREEITSRYHAKMERCARVFFQAVHRRKFAHPSFFSLVVFKIQQRYWQQHADGSYDHQYWKAKGWTDRRADFYIPHEAGRLKVWLARAVGAALAPFVS